MFDTRMIPKLTVALIAISVIVAFGSKLGNDYRMLAPLLFDEAAIRQGQYWRLLTPIFVHFGILHIGFNSVMTYSFGAIVEFLKGPVHMFVFVIVSGVLSNLAQAIMPALLAGPGVGYSIFGGLSGVVYAMFGYVWMQSQFNPTVHIPLNKQAVLMILGWFVLCWVGIIPGIANWAHTGGLLIGVVWGIIAAQLDVRRVKRR